MDKETRTPFYYGPLRAKALYERSFGAKLEDSVCGDNVFGTMEKETAMLVRLEPWIQPNMLLALAALH
nr:hypothetical protein CFP56_28891 [Quercus suber]